MPDAHAGMTEGFRRALTSRCMNCCQSAILPLAFGVRVKSTFSEVDVHVKGAVLLHLLQAQMSKSKLFKAEKHRRRLQIHPHRPVFLPPSLLTPPQLCCPYIPSNPHLWDLHFLIVLITAIQVLPCGPVSINQVPVKPEEGFCVVEVREDLLLGHVHVEVLTEPR